MFPGLGGCAAGPGIDGLKGPAALRLASHSSKKEPAAALVAGKVVGPLELAAGAASCDGQGALAGIPVVGWPKGRWLKPAGRDGLAGGWVAKRLNMSASTCAFERPYLAADNCLRASAS